MLLKKIVLIGSAVAALGLPVLASANLETQNNTSLPSSVQITSGKLKPCSSKYGAVTPAHGHLSTPLAQVKFICGQMSGTCTADVYASANCTGTKVASVTIDLQNLNVNASPAVDPYTLTAAGSSVTIDGP